MASKNKLLGLGAIQNEEKPIAKVQVKAPAWRYHETAPDGIIVKTDEQLAKLDKAGWKDHPGKVRLIPGFKHLFKDTSK